MDKNPNILMQRLAAVGTVVALSIGAAACGGDSDSDIAYRGDGSSTSVEGSERTAGDDLFNPFNPSAEELAQFDCLDEDNEDYGIVISEYEGTSFVEQVLPAQMPVEIAEKDPFHREASNSLDSPFTVDLTKNNEVHAELAANFCAKPALLGATLHQIANTPLRGQIIGEHAPKLEEFVGITADEASAMLTNPHNEEVFPADKIEQFVAENMAATKKREELAEYLVAVLADFQKRGNVTDLELHSDYALNQVSNFDRTAPAKYSVANYQGDAFMYDLTAKGLDCVDLTLGFNTGATTNGLPDDGDKRPVIVVEGDVCEDEPGTPPTTPDITTPPTGTTIPNKRPVPPVGANTDPGAGGSEEEGNDPQNDSNDNGYGPGDSQATVASTEAPATTAADTVPATTGELVPGSSVVANGNNGTAPANTDPTQGGVEGDPGAPQD